MSTCENIKEILKNDRFATEAAGITIDEIKPDYARCSMPVKNVHLNANNTVMGGAVFTLADYAFAAASNSAGMNTVSLTSSITFLGAARKDDVLTAEAVCVRSGKSTCTFSIEVKSNDGSQIAIIMANGFRKQG